MLASVICLLALGGADTGQKDDPMKKIASTTTINNRGSKTCQRFIVSRSKLLGPANYLLKRGWDYVMYTVKPLNADSLKYKPHIIRLLQEVLRCGK